MFFQCVVGASGKVAFNQIFRETPGSKLLKEQVQNAIDTCWFIPAVYNGKRTEVLFDGAVFFAIRDGKPHLRLYCNQNAEDLKAGNDFVAAQLIVATADLPVIAWDPMLQKARKYLQNGAVLLSITVDRNANQKDLRVILEDPSGFGFADATRKLFVRANYIPGFRNGQAAECKFDEPIYIQVFYFFQHSGRGP